MVALTAVTASGLSARIPCTEECTVEEPDEAGHGGCASLSGVAQAGIPEQLQDFLAIVLVQPDIFR